MSLSAQEESDAINSVRTWQCNEASVIHTLRLFRVILWIQTADDDQNARTDMSNVVIASDRYTNEFIQTLGVFDNSSVG